jgi:hypothetical protein
MCNASFFSNNIVYNGGDNDNNDCDDYSIILHCG